MAKGRIVIAEELCKGCQLCTAVCPSQLIHMAEHFNRKGYHPAALADQISVAVGVVCVPPSARCGDYGCTGANKPSSRSSRWLSAFTHRHLAAA